jgi:hypothetical protein
MNAEQPASATRSTAVDASPVRVVDDHDGSLVLDDVAWQDDVAFPVLLDDDSDRASAAPVRARRGRDIAIGLAVAVVALAAAAGLAGLTNLIPHRSASAETLAAVATSTTQPQPRVASREALLLSQPGSTDGLRGAGVVGL